MTSAPMARQQPIGSGFDARSTADDVLTDHDLGGKHAIVTGGYSGLGLEITRALVSAGASVVVPARRPETATDELQDLVDRGSVEVVAMDLADLASITRFADAATEQLPSIDMVINNAGIMAAPEQRVGPGWESHFAVNHLGHFVLVAGLLPVLSLTGSRVVSVSSSGHFASDIRWDDLWFERGYDRWQAYGQAKTANALFAVHLDAVGRDRGIKAFSLHPGSILTPLQRHVPHGEQVRLGWISPEGEPAHGFKTPQQGAATAVWAATSPALDDRGGEYLQDCDVAAPATTDDMGIGGVKPWAIDQDQARRLWELSAELVGLQTCP